MKHKTDRLHFFVGVKVEMILAQQIIFLVVCIKSKMHKKR